MKHYAILANPGHNRIYFDTAMEIAVSELSAITKHYNIKLDEIKQNEIDLPACITFKTENELESDVLEALGTSSIYYALFEIMDENLLKPIKPIDFHTFPESMVQILKYTGKTNEQFTRLMVNLAVSACKTKSKTLKLIDPMCGKGTTLYEGLIRGLDVVGVEINSQWTQEIKTFIVRYMKTGKYKHKAQDSKKSDAKGKKIAKQFTLVAAATKEEFSDCPQNFEIFNADTRKVDVLLKKSSCDMLVSDLPYGVKHGSKSDKEEVLERSPINLLKESIAAWQYVLKAKGSLVISFNEFTLKYADVKEILEENEFEVLDESPYNNYLHRVDQSINRNLIVAVKK